jgi:hypothetical protein
MAGALRVGQFSAVFPDQLGGISLAYFKNLEVGMKQARRFLIALSAFALVLGALPALAQEDSEVQMEESALAQGELIKVDSSAKTVTIWSAQGGQLKFNYNDHTKVTGTEGQVAGLATMGGVQVSVKYTMYGTEMFATEIQVQGRRPGPPPRG